MYVYSVQNLWNAQWESPFSLHSFTEALNRLAIMTNYLAHSVKSSYYIYFLRRFKLKIEYNMNLFSIRPLAYSVVYTQSYIHICWNKNNESCDQERSTRCLKGIQPQQWKWIFCNEFILKIKSCDNRLMNIHDLMNKKVAAILPYAKVPH